MHTQQTELIMERTVYKLTAHPHVDEACSDETNLSFRNRNVCLTEVSGVFTLVSLHVLLWAESLGGMIGSTHLTLSLLSPCILWM